MGIIEIKKNESGRSKWRKPCPRCGAEGIARSDPNYPQYVIVEWSNGHRDTVVRLKDFLNPRFGCGYDGGADLS